MFTYFDETYDDFVTLFMARNSLKLALYTFRLNIYCAVLFFFLDEHICCSTWHC